MARQRKLPIELLSDIGSKAHDLQAFTEPEILAALKFMRSANGPLFDWLTGLLVAAKHRQERPDLHAETERSEPVVKRRTDGE